MFFIKLLLLYLSIYGILFLSGWGVCERICKGKNAEHKIVLAFAIGAILLTAATQYFMLLGINTFASSWISCVIFSSMSFYYFYKNIDSFRKSASQFSYVLILSLTVAVFPAFWTILKAGHLTTISNSYPIFITYYAEYLLTHSIYDIVTPDYYKPINNIIYDAKLNGGFFFFVAAFTAIYGIPPHQLYTVLCGVVCSLIPICVFTACVNGFKLTNKVALLTSLLVAINASYLAWPLMGQLPMVAGITFLVLGIGFLPDMLSCDKKEDYVLYSLIVAGIIFMYGVLAPYMAGIALIYLIFQIVKFPRKTLEAIRNLGIISFLSFLMIPTMFIFLWHLGYKFTSTTSQFTKNIPRYPYLEELFGFGQHFSMQHDGSIKYYLIALITVCVAVLVIIGLYDRFKKRDYLFLSTAGFIFTLSCFFYMIDFTYHFYKHSVIGVFLIICAFVIGARAIYEKSNQTFTRAAIGIFISIFIILNLNTYYGISFAAHYPAIAKPMMDLESLSGVIPKDKVILVNLNDPTEEAWVSYFLREFKIKLHGAVEPWGFWILSPFSGEPNNNYFYNYTTDNPDYTLSRKIKNNDDIIEINYGETIYENEEYRITQDIPEPYLYRGWHDAEKTGGSIYRWTKRDGILTFRKPKELSAFIVNGEVPHVYDNSIEISVGVNEKIIDSFSHPKGTFSRFYVLEDFLLMELTNTMCIKLNKTFSPRDVLKTNDMRDLGIKINSIQIFPLRSLKVNQIIDIGNIKFNKHLARGWSQNEISPDGTSFAWVEGNEAALNIYVEKLEEMQMKFRAMPFYFPGFSGQKTTIFVNGKLIDEIDLKDSRWCDYNVHIPSNALVHGLNSISFVLAYSNSPISTIPGSGDSRKLSAAFDYIEINSQWRQK